MARVIEATKGQIRDLPIMPRLREILSKAADAAGVDTVRVTSGGQAKKGTGGKRTGSVRHDLGGAADLKLEKNGHTLSFENLQERPIIAKFVTEASRLGATGIGAGVSYMGPQTLHVGFGSKATWGAGGKAANAPSWLKAAVAAAEHPPVKLPRQPLQKGDKGPKVAALQRAINLAIGLALKEDGDYGERTEAAVGLFQRKRGIPVTGVADAHTLALLDAD